MSTRDKKLELLTLLEEKRRRDDVYRYKQFGEKLYQFSVNYCSALQAILKFVYGSKPR